MIDFKTIKKLTIGGVELKQLFIGGVQVWKSGYKNWVKFSTESDGTTIYNGGLGYKDGIRVRSGGAEGNSTHHSSTGFIPCKAGDVIRFKFDDGKPIWTDNTNVQSSFNVFDSNFANIGQLTSQPSHYGIFSGTNEISMIKLVNGAWEYTMRDNADIAFIRFTVPYNHSGEPGCEGLIVTVNEELGDENVSQPVTTNIALTPNLRIGSDGTDRTQAGYCVTPWIDLTGIPKPCTIHLTKAKWANDNASDGGYCWHYAKKADGTKISGAQLVESSGSGYFTVVRNGGKNTDVTVTVTSDEVATIRFSGQWASKEVSDDWGLTNWDSVMQAEATLTYTSES